MKGLSQKYRSYLTNKAFLLSLGLSFLMLFLSFFINFYAGIYATESASNPVTDIILDNIPVFHLDELFIYGPFVMWFLVAILLIREPKMIPFSLRSIALFLVIRSVFISLTHIGPFPDQIFIDYDSEIIKNFTFGGDLFFSAHTGLPFLMALIFHKNKALLYFFTATAIFFGCVVLMAHVHYSIDVLSAFFITYTIYHISGFLFKNEKKIFTEGLAISDPKL